MDIYETEDQPDVHQKTQTQETMESAVSILSFRWGVDEVEPFVFVYLSHRFD